MRAELNFLSSSDADPLQRFAPDGAFGISVSAMIGPPGEQRYESFDFVICTPEWCASNMRSHIETGQHYLFVRLRPCALGRICSGRLRQERSRHHVLPFHFPGRRPWAPSHDSTRGPMDSRFAPKGTPPE
ncbi:MULTISPECIES: Imm8 family immunity protein [unclassified Bradyrhizobium]|uniref:Imm8 family immunity protein n=1 Tax=unclassified Bradyrhizobium TaxID=2631580 RepID=UPI0028ECA93A|nr:MULTISPECIES: Imm8 family immunity protein [unclassified Bradyrhizobium]